jgi:8-oxo-dGTP pyrophosphatase MutT (NUDIX family)
LDEVDRRWQALCKAKPAYHDGRVCHVTGVHRNGCGGAVIHVVDCAYRFYAVQDQDFDVGCRALGAKGITMRDGQVLLGRRSTNVSAYRGQWEFAPGGAVEPGTDPTETIQRELSEETALKVQVPPTAIALVFDGHLRCWELVYRITPTADEVRPAPGEYDQLQWRRPQDLPSPLSPVSVQIAELLT